MIESIWNNDEVDRNEEPLICPVCRTPNIADKCTWEFAAGVLEQGDELSPEFCDKNPVMYILMRNAGIGEDEELQREHDRSFIVFDMVQKIFKKVFIDVWNEEGNKARKLFGPQSLEYKLHMDRFLGLLPQ